MPKLYSCLEEHKSWSFSHRFAVWTLDVSSFQNKSQLIDKKLNYVLVVIDESHLNGINSSDYGGIL